MRKLMKYLEAEEMLNSVAKIFEYILLGFLNNILLKFLNKFCMNQYF